MSRPNGPELPEPWTSLTMQALAIKAAMERPAGILIRDCPWREAWNGVEPRALTGDEFLRRARFLAAQFVTLGIRPGEAVLIILPNVVEVGLSILACQLAGAVPALAPADDTIDRLRNAAERCGAVMVLSMARVGEIALGEKARQVAAKVMSVRVAAGFGFDLPDGLVSLEGWAEDDVMPFTEAARRQADAGLITFTRAGGTLAAALRSEGQMIAEALAISSVLRLDGRRGLVSLMHPGAAASVAAALILPLFAGAEIRLAGPYDSALLAVILDEAPTAHLYCPDHFAAWLRPEALGAQRLGNLAGIAALARAEGREAAILTPGPLDCALIVDFDERGLAPLRRWPVDGRLALPAALPHPMETILPEDQPFLTIPAAPGEDFGGFAAARLLNRTENPAGKAA